ncbi:MAG: hypothetical protein JW894_13020 [Bacteroidales bacterium]|nr:hypothetical protein [Bacteroidales bacterium]
MTAEKLNIRKFIGINKNKVYTDERLIFNDPDSNFKTIGKSLYNMLKCSYPKYYKMDNLSKLTFLVTEMLNKEVNLKQFNPDKTAIILSNSESTLDTDRKFTSTIDTIPSPAVFVYTLPNIATGEISIRYGLKGENLFLVEESFNPKILVEQTEMLFADSDTEVCITGWTDYIDQDRYKACLWLIERYSGSRGRIFNAPELQNDFNMTE